MEDFADNDFGELYGDLEVLATPAPEEEEQQGEEEDDDDDGSDVKNKDADDDYVGTDSDDDLNIVLNDEGFSGGRDEDVRGDGLGKNMECVDQSMDCSEPVSSDLHGGRSRNGVKGGYGSQFFRSKFMRTQGSMFVNNMKAGESMGLTYGCSSFTKGRGNQISSSGYFDGTCDATNSTAVPYGSFLPWYWNIYDVNIDKLEEKPWRNPGTDITDYFNFGFNENTWKQYCVSLGQLWQTSMQTGIPVNESAKLNQASTSERIDEAVSGSGSLLSPSSKCKAPKGRAIQVENSVVERQPSIHVRRPRSIDSDVIIQIKVHESPDKNSGSVNGNVHDFSEEGEFISGSNRNKNNLSSEHDVLSEEQLEDVKKSEESSGQERNGLIPDVVKAPHPDEKDQHSEDDDVLEEEIQTERVGIYTCSADPCLSEPELSLGDQDLSLTSYTDNDSEETEDSAHVDNKNNHSPLRSHLVNSDTDIKEPLSLYHKTSKNISFNRTSVNISYHSRNRGPWRHQSGRHIPGSKLKKHIENDNNVSHIPKSSGRDLAHRGHQFDNYKYRSKERPQYFGSHLRKDVSYNRETKQSCYYGAENIVDDLVQEVYSEYSDSEDGDSFKENANQYIRKNGDKRECFFERRTLMEYNEDSYWHPASRKHHVDDDDDPSLLSYRESRQFLPKHSSFPAKDRETQRRRMHHKPHFKDGNCDYDQWLDECEFEFLHESYRMPSSSAEREMESLNNKNEEQFLQIDRALNRYAGRGRHCDRPPLVADTLWSRKPEDECPNYTRHQPSYQRQSYTDSARHYVYRVNENFRGHERHKNATNRGSDWHCGYIDATEDEDCITRPVNECEFYPLPSEVPHWTNNDNILWHHDELHPEEDTFFYEETPRHERHARYGSLHARVQSDAIKFQQHQLNLSRRDSDRFLKRSSNVMSRNHCQQAVLRRRKSVDLINREGKSHAKSSRVMCNDRLENVDRGIAKKRTALVGFDDSHKKAINFDTSKSVCDNENKKLLQNVPDKRQKGGECPSFDDFSVPSPCPILFIVFSSQMDIDATGYVDQYAYQQPKMRKYYSEYLAGSDKQRFPLLYCIDYYGKIPRRLRFLDPMGNEFEVAVFKKQGRVYLTKGSEAIGELYGLTEGGLLTLFCFNPGTFLMRVEDRDGNEVLYPTPPMRFTLGNKDSPIDISDDERSYKHSEESFYHSLCKTLSVDDVSSLFMCAGFCEHAFPLKPPVVKMVDEGGRKWDCTLEWNNDFPFDCKLMGGWASFCKKNGLKEGVAVKLGVSQSDPTFLYFKLL